MSKPVLTAVVGDNADLIEQVARIYIPDGSIVADVTFGKGVFWRNVDTSRFTFYASDLQIGTDMRDLPYNDEHFDVIVIDPPYMYHSSTTHKESVDKGYKNNDRVENGIHGVDAVNQMYYDAMKEAKRVLKPEGVMMVKCQDQIMSGKQWRQHIYIFDYATKELDLIDDDLFVLVQKGTPVMRHGYQLHARKNNSFLWIFRKRK